MVQKNPPNNPVRLHAGQLSACFEDGMLRSVYLGSIELVRRIYPALRDYNWNTVPYRVTSQTYTAEQGTFSLVSNLLFLQNGISYSAEISVTGTVDSTIEMVFRGTAHSDFKSNRIGLCLLHPLDLCRNLPCEVTHGDESISHLHFPGDALSPHQPFLDVRAMTFCCGNAGMCTITFTGDTFETEDQRNWTDGSFKTYSTLLSQPIPVTVKNGDTIEQRITIHFTGTSVLSTSQTSLPKSSEPSVPNYTIDIGKFAASSSKSMQIGLGTSTLDTLPPPAAHLIAAASPCHVRVNLDAEKDLTDSVFTNIAALEKSTGSPLECAISFSEEFSGELSEVNSLLLTYRIPCCRILVFCKGIPVTPPLLLQAATDLFSRSLPHTTVFGGTDSYFVEINRIPVAILPQSGICFSANPQVHTFDHRAIIENIDGLSDCTAYAVNSAKKHPVAVTPLTMRPRKNPQKPGKAGGADERQQQLFGAAWLTGAIAACVKSGVASLTCFNELTGDEGIMETDGSQLFPVYHILASGIMNADTMSAEMYGCTTPSCAAVYFTKGNVCNLLIANLTEVPQTVYAKDISEGATCAMLDGCSIVTAAGNPDLWQQTPIAFVSEKLSLEPYAVALLSFC